MAAPGAENRIVSSELFMHLDGKGPVRSQGFKKHTLKIKGIRYLMFGGKNKGPLVGADFSLFLPGIYHGGTIPAGVVITADRAGLGEFPGKDDVRNLHHPLFIAAAPQGLFKFFPDHAMLLYFQNRRNYYTL
jgi:hypothetical protein